MSPTQLQAHLTIQPDATPGLRTVSVATGGEALTLPSAFTVAADVEDPRLTSVSPTSGRQGQTLNVSIVGANTHFLTDAPALTLGSNIVIQPLNVVDDTHLTADVAIDLLADVGGRQGMLTSGSLNFAFDFVVLPSVASIVSVSPSSAAEGSVVSVTVTGQNTHWSQDTTAAYFSYMGCPTPTVSQVTISSPTAAQLLLTVPANACTGPLPLHLATGGEVVNGTFSVYDASPTLTLSPSSAKRGTSVTVNFIGEFTHFTNNAAGPTTAVVDGADVAIENFTVTSPNSATATFVIGPDALTGPCLPAHLSGCHTVTVTTPLGTASEILQTPFRVTDTPATLTRIEPFHAAPGTTTLVRIYGSFTHFATNATALGFGPDISVSHLTVVSPTELTANVTIGSEAALGYRQAFVNTGDEQLTIGFRVDGPASPAITSVSPSFGAQGQSRTVEIVGVNTHFDGNTQLILGAGVTVSQLTVNSATSATAVIDIATTAPIGPNTVVLITPLAGGDEVVSGSAFSVVPGVQQILFIKAANTPDPPTPYPALDTAQNQVVNVEIVGQGTHWLQGGTSAEFGAGIVVNQLSIADATHATAQITVLSTAGLGFHSVGMRTGGEYAFIEQALNVQQATPALLASAPTSGSQGTTFNVQVLGRFTHWEPGVTTASYGDGVTVNSFQVIDSVSGSMSVTIDPLAYIDYGHPYCRALTVTTGTEQVSLPSQLCVTRGPAQVVSVTPAKSPQGSTLMVNVTGQGTNFVQGLTVADFGAGINTTNVTVNNSTSASVSIAVSPTAVNGFRSVSLRTLGEIADKTYAFVVAQDEPTLNAAAPTSAQQGQQGVVVRLFGQHTHWVQGVSTVTFGQGITVGVPTVINSTTIDVPIDVLAQATPGSRMVTVTTGGEIVSATLFSVLSGDDIISEVTPDNGNQGQEIVLTITGQGTEWSQGLTQFSIAGGGGDIKINYVLINSPTSATAGITISPTAALGARSVYMTTASQTLVNANAFVVTGGIPAIASVSPGSGQQDQAGINVQINGIYTEWQTGSPTVDFGPGVTVQNFTVNSDTSITAVVDIAEAAAIGSRTVTVRNGTQALTGYFAVTSSAPPTPYISYLSPPSALRGQTFNISFGGLYTHWNPAATTLQIGDPGTSGITINSFQVTSLTSAVANITIAANAPIDQHTVDIQTDGELVQATFSVVQEVPVITLVDPSSGMQGAKLTVNVLGQYTGFNNTTTFNFGPGIAVGAITVLGPTVAQVEITIDQLAQQGYHAVTATTNGTTVGTGSFYVTASQAVIVAVAPNTARQNDSITVDVTGENTHWDASTTFSFGSGIGITSIDVVDATHATVAITLAPLAPLGGHTVTATTGGEVASMTNAFIVQPGTPLVLSSAPASGQQQQLVTFTILGQFTNWTQADTTVTVGNGVGVTSVTVTGPQSITAEALIDWYAAPGPRTITVTTGPQVLTLPNAFYVTGGPSVIAQVTPNQGGTSETLNVAITGTNTHFAQGGTTVSFGSGITVNSLTVNSLTSATANITIAANAPTGNHNVTLTTQGETATAVNAFTVYSTEPVIQFVSPSSLAQSASGNLKVIGSLTHFDANTEFDFGPGVTVNSKTIVSNVEATVNVSVAALAARTTRDVTAITGSETAVGLQKFSVTAGPAFISSVSPTQGRQNQNGLQVTITGNGTHFTAVAPTVNLGPGVTVTNVQVTSDTLLVATVNIAQNAPVQLNDVSVTTSGELASLAGAFEVKPGLPVVTSVLPLSAKQNQTLDVGVSALYTHFVQGTTQASFGSGITVNTVTVLNATQATVNITINQAATLGSRTVTMTTSGEVASGVGAFTVNAGDPQIQSVLPNTGIQGSTQTVTITGLYTHFDSTSQVSFSGGGVTAGAPTVNGPTQLQVSVTVQQGSAANARTVTVTTGSESASLAGAFTVLPGDPLISVISPNVGVPDSTVNVTITGQFTHFLQGTTRARFGAGVSVNGGTAGDFGFLTVHSQTTATATLTIVAGATLGPRNVNVDTNGEALDVLAGFTIQSTSPTPPTVTVASPLSGEVNVPVNTSIAIQFSAPLNRDTVSAANIRLTDGVLQGGCTLGQTTPGVVTVDASARVVTFTPTAVLAVGRMYYACVNWGQQSTPTSIEDPSGNDIAATYTTFRTGFAPDAGGPSLVAANIAPGATGVGTNVPVMVAFTRSINRITVPAGFTVTNGGNPVAGTISYTGDSKRITFTPSAALSPNTQYVVNLASSLEDSVGNPLVNPAAIVFTTGAGADTVSASVTNSIPTSGQVTGTTPVIRATLSEPINPIYFADGYFYLRHSPTAAIVQGTTVGVSDDRRVVTLNLPRALEPGTNYAWSLTMVDQFGYGSSFGASFRTADGVDSTAPAVEALSPPENATSVPINALIQVAFDQPIDRTVPLVVALTPAVTGTTTVSADNLRLIFTPSANLAPSTTYTVSVTGVRDSSNNLATVPDWSFTTVASALPDTTTGTIVVTPSGSNVPTTTPVVLTLSKPVNRASITSSSVRIYDATVGTDIDGSYSVGSDYRTITFTPANGWPGGHNISVYTSYYAALFDWVDRAFNYSNQSFTVAAAADTTPPQVLTVTPFDGATGIGPNNPITVTFSESLDPASLSGNVALFDGSTYYSGSYSVTSDYTSVTFAHTLTYGATYTVVIGPNVRDLKGNVIAEQFSSTFTVAPRPSTTRPQVMAFRPGTGSGIPADSTVTFMLSEPIAPATVEAALFISQNGVLLTGDVVTRGNNRLVTFTPSTPFAQGALIEVWFTSAATDSAGNMLFDYQTNFTVRRTSSTTAPTVQLINPQNGITNQPTNVVVDLQFTKPLNPATVTSSSVYMTTCNNTTTAISTSLTWLQDTSVLRVAPNSDLAPSTCYYTFMTTAVKDLDGLTLSTGPYHFYTGTSPETTAPAIVAAAPYDGAASIGLNATVRLTFSKRLAVGSVTPQSLRLESGGTAIPYRVTDTVNGADGTHLLTLSAASGLPDAAPVTVTVTDGVTDVFGNGATPFSATFTTAGSPDFTSPSVVNSTVFQGDVDVPVTSVFTVTFDRPLDIRTLVMNSTVYLRDGYNSTLKPITLSLNNTHTQITVAATTLLAVNRSYQLVFQSVTDLTGNYFGTFSAQFTTALRPPTPGPVVRQIVPYDGFSQVPVNIRPMIEFDRSISRASLSGVTLMAGGSPVAYSPTFAAADTNLTMVPAGILEPNTTYVLTIAGVKDTGGAQLASPSTVTFVTGPGIDLVAPTATAQTPLGGNILTTKPMIRWQVSEPLHKLPGFGGYLYNNTQSRYVPGITMVYTPDARSIRLHYPGALMPKTSYSACPPSLIDLAGNDGGVPCVSFTTGEDVDAAAFLVTAVAPSDGAAAVPRNARITLRFNKPVDPTSFVGAPIVLSPAAPGTTQLSPDRLIATFTPTGPLAASTVYSVSVSTGAFSDVSGVAVTSFASTFTTSGATDISGGTISLTNPSHGSVGVATNSAITVTFSEPYDALRLVNESFVVATSTGARLAGTLAPGGQPNTLVFTPVGPLPSNQLLGVYVGYFAAVYDLVGNGFSYTTGSFTTAATADTAAPQLLSVTPVDGATNQGPFTTVTLTFSESLDPSTVDYRTFALYQGYTNLNASITRSSDNRTVIMTRQLPYDGTITVIVGTGVTDIAGNPLASTYRSTFTTLPLAMAASPRITQMRPGGGAPSIEPNTLITLYASNTIDAATASQGVAVVANGVLVDGAITVDPDGYSMVFTPAQPFAPGAVVQVFAFDELTDTTGIPFTPYSNAFTIRSDFAGQPLALSNYYPPYGTSNVLTNVVIDLQFNKDINPADVTSANVYLTTCGLAAVPSTATLIHPRGVRLTPSAPLTPAACYYYNVGMGLHALDGTTLSGAFASYFYAGSGTDADPPMVTRVTPMDGTTNIGDNATIRVVFSEPMAEPTLNTATVLLHSGGNQIPVSLSFTTTGTPQVTMLTVTPQQPLPDNASVVLSLTTSVTDRAGLALVMPDVTFQTGNGPDTTPPVLIERSPAPAQTSVVPTNTRTFAWQFDEPIDPATAVSPNVAVWQFIGNWQMRPSTVALSADGRTILLTLASDLVPSSSSQMCAQSLLDLSGNDVSAGCMNFSTLATADLVAPQVQGHTPLAGAVGVPLNTVIEVTFDAPIGTTSLSQVTLKAGTTVVPYKADWPGFTNLTVTRVLRLVPAELLDPNTTYTVTIEGVTDIAGNVAPATSFSFTTGQNYQWASTSYLSANVVVSGVVTNLVNGQTINGVSPTTPVRVLFSEPITFASLASGGIQIQRVSNNAVMPVAVSLSPDGKVATLTPTPPLLSGIQYRVTVNYNVAIWNQAGYQISGNAGSLGFTTGTAAIARERIGNTNPSTAGFIAVGGPGGGPVSDNGVDAWQVIGGAGGDGYGYALLEAEKVAAYSNGWRLTAVARVLNGNGFANVDFGNGRRRFDINLIKTGDGNTLVRLNNSVPPGPSPEYTVQGTDYHTYELVFDPTTQTATLFIDGVPRLTGYAGHTNFIGDFGPWFGATSGTVNHNLIRFEIMP
jgi:hypothetical protein